MPSDSTPLILDRRASEQSALLILVQQVHTSVQSLDTRLSEHMKDETLELAQAVAALMIKSFPEGDGDGHRRHHEAVIKQAEEKAEFWKKMVTKLSEWGLIGFAGWLLYAMWDAVLRGHVK